MRTGVAIGRLLILAGLTAKLILLNFLRSPVRLFSRSRSRALTAWIFRTWARGASRILGLHVTVEGEVPQRPGFLVTNHLGYLDIVVLASLLPCCFVSKSEVAGWPVLGFLARAMNTIFVDRRLSADLPRVVQFMKSVVEARLSVVFFPEGTSSSGEQVLDFKPSLFEAVAASGQPVACASLWYGTPQGHPPARLAVCWWGDMTFADHFWRLLQLPRIDAVVRFGQGAVVGQDRKQLAQQTFLAVQQQFEPVVEGGS